jgi:hypothetical protein
MTPEETRRVVKEAIFAHQRPPVTKVDKGISIEELRRRIYAAGEKALGRVPRGASA